jgi:hypothetical protein
MADDAGEFMLTTMDNPWNPWTHWDEWLAFDHSMGYDTPSLLARVSGFSFDLSDTDQDLVVQEAIDEIVKRDFLDRYRKISKNEMVKI